MKLEYGKNSPRSYVSKDHIKMVAQSIKKNGLLQPILVERIPVIKGQGKPKYKYRIVHGFIRYSALQMLKINVSHKHILIYDNEDFGMRGEGADLYNKFYRNRDLLAFKGGYINEG